MGCGNSTAASTAAGPSESVKDVQDESSVDDEKRRNYGGVYVGLPADLSNVAIGQTPSTHKGENNDV
ncbi:overexpressed in colon carcinoma 1 protein homolog isoform X2 [Chanodichthys erythropterus]|uniref:overexpressed in colon carcinoma 1 protein homolog isoform X2 n=1 Tax=Chanodichthys erythropterus TaxID=933992 RepID=UPI00351F50AD